MNNIIKEINDSIQITNYLVSDLTHKPEQVVSDEKDRILLFIQHSQKFNFYEALEQLQLYYDNPKVKTKVLKLISDMKKIQSKWFEYFDDSKFVLIPNRKQRIIFEPDLKYSKEIKQAIRDTENLLKKYLEQINEFCKFYLDTNIEEISKKDQGEKKEDKLQGFSTGLTDKQIELIYNFMTDNKYLKCDEKDFEALCTGGNLSKPIEWLISYNNKPNKTVFYTFVKCVLSQKKCSDSISNEQIRKMNELFRYKGKLIYDKISRPSKKGQNSARRNNFKKLIENLKKILDQTRPNLIN